MVLDINLNPYEVWFWQLEGLTLKVKICMDGVVFYFHWCGINKDRCCSFNKVYVQEGYFCTLFISWMDSYKSFANNRYSNQYPIYCPPLEWKPCCLPSTNVLIHLSSISQSNCHLFDMQLCTFVDGSTKRRSSYQQFYLYHQGISGSGTSG